MTILVCPSIDAVVSAKAIIAGFDVKLSNYKWAVEYPLEGLFSFYVPLKDTDAGEFVPMAIIYKDADSAIAYAQSIL